MRHSEYSEFLLFNFILGVAISAVPVYLSEVSSHNIRGQTGALSALSICKFFSLSSTYTQELIWFENFSYL